MQSPPDDSTYAPGTLVANRLRVVRVIGVGGMGTVYEVEHELTKHRRALKVLHARAARQPSVVERFVREASAAARVANAHVAETFDAGRLDTGEPYLLMELIDGETLEQRLQRAGPIDVGELCDLVHQACEGVHAAHLAGIVHRDLKPENLIVTARDGAPFLKVLDFGISKFDSARTGALGITTEGSVMGTPYYMSPEQVLASTSLDARTDVYSLGVILYECACGERPYEAQSVEHLAVLIHEGKAMPLDLRRPGLPGAFCAAVHRAIAVSRDARFASARELAEAIGPLRTPAAVARAVSWSAPPVRVVIHPSGPPPSENSVRLAGAVTTSAGTATGLAATEATDLPAPGVRRVSGWWWVAAGGALAVAAGAGTIVWSSPHAAPPLPASLPIRSEPEAIPLPALPTAPSASVSLAPLPAAIPSAAPAGASPVAISALRPTAPSARPGASGSASSAPAPAGSRSRVDENGLAGENPFR
jgi:eukaryotic-like serine/threonine-protein kinase